MTAIRLRMHDTFPIPVPGPPSREVLIGTFPAGAYRVQVEADGVTLWCTAPTGGTRDAGQPVTAAEMQRANEKFWGTRR